MIACLDCKETDPEAVCTIARAERGKAAADETTIDSGRACTAHQVDQAA
jgi:hypothetical protein